MSVTKYLMLIYLENKLAYPAGTVRMHSFDVNLHQEKNEATEFVLKKKTPKTSSAIS